MKIHVSIFLTELFSTLTMTELQCQNKNHVCSLQSTVGSLYFLPSDWEKGLETGKPNPQMCCFPIFQPEISVFLGLLYTEVIWGSCPKMGSHCGFAGRGMHVKQGFSKPACSLHPEIFHLAFLPLKGFCTLPENSWSLSPAGSRFPKS